MDNALKIATMLKEAAKRLETTACQGVREPFTDGSSEHVTPCSARVVGTVGSKPQAFVKNESNVKGHCEECWYHVMSKAETLLFCCCLPLLYTSKGAHFFALSRGP